MKKFVIFTTILLASTFAQARYSGGGEGGVLLDLNAFMYNQKSDNNGTTSESNTAIYDIKLGYLPGSGLYLGGIYTSRNHSGNLSDSGSATGLSAGYMGESGFYLMGHYYFTATNGDYKEGSGYQADFGYLALVSGAFYVGTELTYRSIKYKKLNNVDADYTSTELFPMLTVAFVF